MTFIWVDLGSFKSFPSKRHWEFSSKKNVKSCFNVSLPMTDPCDWQIYLHEWLIFMVFMYINIPFVIDPDHGLMKLRKPLKLPFFALEIPKFPVFHGAFVLGGMILGGDLLDAVQRHRIFEDGFLVVWFNECGPWVHGCVPFFFVCVFLFHGFLLDVFVRLTKVK